RKSPTAGRDQRMEVDHRLATIELLEDRAIGRIAGPLVAVVGLQAEPISLQRAERIVDLPQARVDVDHRQRGEEAEALGIVAHHLRTEVVANASHLLYF